MSKSQERTFKTSKISMIAKMIASAVLCSSLLISSAYANPLDAVSPTEDGTVGIYGSGSGGYREPDDNELGIDEDQQIRDEQGIVSQLSTDTHNPYNGQIRLDIDIGSEFAEFEGCEFTEGIRVKVSPGGLVELPPLRAREGFYFVGWGQGGVPYEPTWSPFVTLVEMGTDTSEGKNTSIFALYADEDGNGYCTCGAYEAGIYSEKMDEIRQINQEYDDTIGYHGVSDGTVKVLSCLFIIVVCVAVLVIAGYKDHKDGQRGDVEYL